MENNVVNVEGENDEVKKENKGNIEMTEVYGDSEKLKLQTNPDNHSKNGQIVEAEVKINIKSNETGKINYAPISQEGLNTPHILLLNSNEKRLEDEELLGKMILDVDKGLLVNEKEYDGAANDDIDDAEIFQKLEEEVELQHPKKKLEEGGYEPYFVCNTQTGNMGCGEKQSKSDLEPLGLGMVVYFKILKAFTIVFLCIVIINIPLYYIYTINHNESAARGYKDMLFKTTIGNVGSCK
jgi:hypothetical protein